MRSRIYSQVDLVDTRIQYGAVDKQVSIYADPVLMLIVGVVCIVLATLEVKIIAMKEVEKIKTAKDSDLLSQINTKMDLALKNQEEIKNQNH